MVLYIKIVKIVLEVFIRIFFINISWLLYIKFVVVVESLVNEFKREIIIGIFVLLIGVIKENLYIKVKFMKVSRRLRFIFVFCRYSIILIIKVFINKIMLMMLCLGKVMVLF